MNVPLGHLAEVRMGYSFRSRLELCAEGDVAVIQMKDLDDAKLLHSDRLARVRMPDLKDHHCVQEGDLLFRSRGESNAASRVAADLGRTVLAAPMLLIRPSANQVEPAYLQWFINHPATQTLLASHAEGTAVKMISKAALERIVVAVPSLSVQRRIIEIGQLAIREAALGKQLLDRRKALVDALLLQKAQQTSRNNA
jgi:hypothetical protein